MIYLEELRYRYQLIVGYVGVILIGVGLSFLLPLLVIVTNTDELKDIPYFVIPSILSLILGMLMKNRMKKVKNTALTLQEGGVIVIISWFLTVIFSALPFILSGQLNFTQAMFESVSGWTTTGLSVVDVTKTSNVFLLWRSVMQFFGGAGLAVVMLSTIIGPHGLGLYHAEGRDDKLLPHVAKSTKLIMNIYLGYVMAGIVLYMMAGMPWFDAINHAIAALSTGGFSTKVNSIGEYNNIAIEMITIILMILGTINFAAHFILLKGQMKKFLKLGHIRFMFFLFSLAIPFVVAVTLVPLYGSLGKSIRVGIFEIVSALSTTGFSTVGYSEWNSFGIFVLIILMLIGGGAGSTAGGMKQYRVYIMIKSLIWNVKGFFLPPNVVREEYIYRPNGKYYVSKNHINEIGSFITLYLIAYILGVLVLLMYGYPLQESLFEFASSLGTVGLSVGITSANAPVGVLWVQIVGMMLGRLEFFVVFYAGVKMFRDIKLIVQNKIKG